MRSCTRPREPLAAFHETRGKQEKPHPELRLPRRVQEKPLRARKKRLKVRGKPGAGRDRALRPRSRPLRGRGRPHETKSLLEHLIKSIEERDKAARLASR